MFAPAFLNWGTYHEHGYIAHYMWATALGYIIVLVIASRPGATSKKDPKNPDIDSTFVSVSYLLAGFYAAAVHAVRDLSFSRLFIPTPSKFGNPSTNIFVEGAHLFTQFDWHIVVLTCMVFAYLQVEEGTKLQAPIASLLRIAAKWETQLAIGSICVTTALFGPGAAASFGLAIREQGLRAASRPTKTL
ncbi:MAG: hypothetical protein Q9225_000395 [Loekoesia sp. 1 TL-2023]